MTPDSQYLVVNTCKIHIECIIINLELAEMPRFFGIQKPKKRKETI